MAEKIIVSRSIAVDIGDAIREKEGSTGPIPMADMADRIRAIETGEPEGRKRPSDYPDMGRLPRDSEFMCLVYDSSIDPDSPMAAHVYTSSTSAKVDFSVGYVQGGSFVEVYKETKGRTAATINSGFTHSVSEYTGQCGRFVILLAKLQGTSYHISYGGFSQYVGPGGKAITQRLGREQACVERYTRRPNATQVVNNSGAIQSCRHMVNEVRRDFRASLSTDITLAYRFFHETGVQHVDLSGSNIRNSTSRYQSFYMMSSLERIDGIEGNTIDVGPGCTTLYYIFGMCERLKGSRTFTGGGGIKTIASAFYYCRSVTGIDMGGLEMGALTTMASAFYFCSAAKSIVPPNFSGSTLTTVASMFACCKSVESLDLSGLNLSACTTVAYLFQNCYSLRELTLPSGDFAPSGSSIAASTAYNGGGFYQMFYYCKSLREIDLTPREGGLSQKCGTIYQMFYYCQSLRSLRLPQMLLDVTASANMAAGFDGCRRLEDVECVNLPPYNLSHFSQSQFLTHDSLVNMFAALPEVTTSRTITIGTVNKSRLSSDELAVAVSKNWTVA